MHRSQSHRHKDRQTDDGMMPIADQPVLQLALRSVNALTLVKFKFTF